MKAVQFESTGEPSQVLRCVQVEQPQPEKGEVLVRMLASPVNPSDMMFIRGCYTLNASPPAVPGFEGVGVVEKSGGGLRGMLFKGRRVIVLNKRGGNWADYAVVPSDQVIPCSSGLTDEQAATFFVNPATAWVMTQEVLRVPRGGWLLQSAASSSLGRMIVRLGQHCGFRTLNLVRRDAQVAPLKALGADHVAVFDGAHGSADDLRNIIRTATGQTGIQWAVDPVGGETASAIVQCLGPGGSMLVYGTLSNAPMQLSPRTLMTVGSRVEGFWLGNFMSAVSLPFKLRLVRRITGLIRTGVLATEIRASFPLEDVTAAVRLAEDNAGEGKVLLLANKA